MVRLADSLGAEHAIWSFRVASEMVHRKIVIRHAFVPHSRRTVAKRYVPFPTPILPRRSGRRPTRCARRAEIGGGSAIYRTPGYLLVFSANAGGTRATVPDIRAPTLPRSALII